MLSISFAATANLESEFACSAFTLSLRQLTLLTADEIWPEVWQYGFDDVEESIQADLDADAYFKTHPGIDNAEVMAKARALIAAYGKQKRKTG
nr:hypothetical protein [Duganella aquatilis]